MVGSFLLPVASMQAETKPNVVVIYVDDMGIGDIGCYGGKFVPTPNIDKIAQDGLLFNQYYSSAPVSSPSRCGLTTGKFPIEVGINTFLNNKASNKKCEQRNFLSDKNPSMARAFQNAGYATGHIGKWHMGGGRDVHNAPSIKNYGFDEYISTYESPTRTGNHCYELDMVGQRQRKTLETYRVLCKQEHRLCQTS